MQRNARRRDAHQTQVHTMRLNTRAAAPPAQRCTRAFREKAVSSHAYKPTAKFNQARHKVEAKSVRIFDTKNDTIF